MSQNNQAIRVDMATVEMQGNGSLAKNSNSMASQVLKVLVAFALVFPSVGYAGNKNRHKPSTKAAATEKAKSARGAKGKGPSQSPAQFIATRAQKVLAELKSRRIRPGNELEQRESKESKAKLEPRASKVSWLDSVYQTGLVDHSSSTGMLADKRILAEVLKIELGPRALQYYPKTLGLREFLMSRDLLNSRGQVIADGDKIDTLLHEEFPAGFVIRPAVGVGPHETGRGIFAATDDFIVELLKEKNFLYDPNQRHTPVENPVLKTVASGEAYVIQENIITAADVHKPLKNRFFQEVRIHTFEDRVVERGVPDRWVQTNLLRDDEISKAEKFAADFLRSLPLSVLMRQAWGLDVAVFDNGEMRVIDVVTNRGNQNAWSSYLDQPRVIGAYSRHFERYYGIEFAGVSGSLIRNNMANYLPYWSKRIEKAKPGLNKVLAFLPPMP